MSLLGILSGRRIRPERVSVQQALEEISAREHVHFSALVIEGSILGLGYDLRKALPHYLGYGRVRTIGYTVIDFGAGRPCCNL